MPTDQNSEPPDAAHAPSTCPPTRTLRFPTDRSVGRLKARRPAPRDAEAAYPTWRYRDDEYVEIGDAHGDVEVPAGAELALYVDRVDDLAWLDALPPDALAVLDGIYIPRGIVDDDLAHLAHLTGLLALDLTLARAITDRGLAALAGMASLRSLALPGTAIADAGLASLRDLPELQSLDLSRTAITDAGLDTLAALTWLRELSLPDPGVSEAGVERLKAALPATKIYHY